ncbi:hypothetical protein [Legionella cardiaca]|uniref:Uncharacterized protein n=1 Tax=Legionella cardiaca TaxID=1071983 RepID=A0ABY8AWW7_9GAMM|nr:hypothetical protein [Legionella cardiaca]WED43990.1 hypothetical protein PXX05_04180 [Legionella cardiaca]
MKKSAKDPSKTNVKENLKKEDLKNISGGRRRPSDDTWRSGEHPLFPGVGRKR